MENWFHYFFISFMESNIKFLSMSDRLLILSGNGRQYELELLFKQLTCLMHSGPPKKIEPTVWLLAASLALTALTWDPLLAAVVAKTFFFVGLPIGVNHQSVGEEVGLAVFLQVARLLAETANNSFWFTIVSVSIEAAEVGLELRLSLSEADRIDGLELLFCEVIFFFSDRWSVWLFRCGQPAALLRCCLCQPGWRRGADWLSSILSCAHWGRLALWLVQRLFFCIYKNMQSKINLFCLKKDVSANISFHLEKDIFSKNLSSLHKHW